MRVKGVCGLSALFLGCTIIRCASFAVAGASGLGCKCFGYKCRRRVREQRKRATDSLNRGGDIVTPPSAAHPARRHARRVPTSPTRATKAEARHSKQPGQSHAGRHVARASLRPRTARTLRSDTCAKRTRHRRMRQQQRRVARSSQDSLSPACKHSLLWSASTLHGDTRATCTRQRRVSNSGGRRRHS